MAWNLFKPKAAKPAVRPEPVLRWFGKLPIKPDYYRSEGDDEWVVEFNDWLIKGFDLYLTRWNSADVGDLVRAGQIQRVRRLPLCSCIVRLPKSGMTVITSIQDYGGDNHGRHFPIAFYVAVPTASWPGPTSDRLGPGLGILAQLTALRNDVVRFCRTPGRFETAFGSRQIDLSVLDAAVADATWVDQANSVLLSEWYASAAGHAGDMSLEQWLARVRACARRVEMQASDKCELTLDFPLGPAIPKPIQIAGWLQWLGNRIDIDQRSLSLMIANETAESAARLAVIARQELLPDDFLLLTPLYRSLPYIEDLSFEAKGDGAVAPAGPASEMSMNTTWAEFVGGAPGPS